MRTKCFILSEILLQNKGWNSNKVWNRGHIFEKHFQSCFLYLIYFTCLGPPSMTQRISSVEVSENGTMVLSPSFPVKTKVDEVSEILWRLLRFKLHSILCWKKGIWEKFKKTFLSVSALLESMQSATRSHCLNKINKMLYFNFKLHGALYEMH